MKNNGLFRRLSALALCCALLLALPLPQAFATGDDFDEDVSDTDTAGQDGAADAGGTQDATTSGGLADPQIDATAALLVNPDTGMVLYEKNADEKRYPASTTKIMTALLTLEHADLADTVTAEEVDFEGVAADASNADIKVGETVTVKDLLYAIMLPSANEAANMLARHVGGSVEGFVEMMNAKAEELGCKGTHFMNANGLHDPEHYTTARDLLIITQAVMQDETFTNIVDTVQYRMAATNMHQERIIYTTNQLIFSSFQPWYYAYCKGVKTGHTSEAGNCLVSYAVRGKARLYSVVLGCADAPDSSTVAKSFTSTSQLFDWGFTNFVSKTLAKKGDEITRVKIELSTDTDELVLTAQNDLVASIPKNLELEDLDATPTVPESRKAPVKAGDVIGSLTYSYAGVEYGTVQLVALNDVEMSQVLYYADKLENFFKSSVFKIVLVVLAIFIVLYILFNLTFGGMRRRKQRKNMRSRYENANYQRRRRK
ncbi:MAG: D-alanyl-D-alanine carboxypeptidase family protein [Eubacteriales bacterium]|nr:D-alanyl-D-alanine carboxypeptidase family protein [Eubacteriales bacterium]